MANINNNFTYLKDSYLFSEIGKKVAAYKAANPEQEVISLGIGDVTRPLCNSVISALHNAVEEMANGETFRGYAPECGYGFLKDAIVKNDYTARGVELSADEVFVNDGAKSSLGHFGDILSAGNVVAISDPVYPVYIDTNVMEGRAGVFGEDGKWSNIVYLSCPQDKGFVPQIPNEKVDVIYICSPNNPTGGVLNREQLKAWVDYAKANKAIILYDGAYEAFISDENIPHSIYEIEGAKEVAVEFRSFSKTAGFTGVRCGYTVVPKELICKDDAGNDIVLNKLWNRHQSTKFNGTAYIIQRGAEAIYTEKGQEEIKETVAYYMENAKMILEGLKSAGFRVSGGENAPYIWVETPKGLSSWEFFDRVLNECQVVGTPGVGFGPSGEGYFRFTAFAKRENVIKAIERIKSWKL